MANKYDFTPAYYDVYISLKTSFTTKTYSLGDMDNKTKNLAIEYLTVAASRGVPNAKTELDSVKAHLLDRR